MGEQRGFAIVHMHPRRGAYVPTISRSLVSPLSGGLCPRRRRPGREGNSNGRMASAATLCGVYALAPRSRLTPRSRVSPASWIEVPQETALPQPARRTALWLRLRRLFAAEAEETLSSLMLLPDADTMPAEWCDFGRLRVELEAAGFQPFTERDLQLSRALNVGYLLRLSIEPSLSSANASLADDFYGSRLINGTRMLDVNASLPFEGRMLLLHRGYGTEITRGRLLLPKLDYLQARRSPAVRVRAQPTLAPSAPSPAPDSASPPASAAGSPSDARLTHTHTQRTLARFA